MTDIEFSTPSWPFAAAVYNSKRDRLLKPEQYDRLLTLSGEGLVRALIEMGYAKPSDSADLTVRSLTESSISELKDSLCKTVPDLEVTNLFFIEYDAHNIKVLLKARLLDRDCDEFLSSNGTINTALIKACISANEFSTLGEDFVSLSELENESDAQKISASVDKACYAHLFNTLKKKHIPLLSEYFTRKAKYTNELTKIRAKRLMLSDEALQTLLIPAGNAKYSISIHGQSVEEIELERENSCASLLYTHRNDTDGPAASAHYIGSKLLEVRNLRLIDALGAQAAPLLTLGYQEEAIF